MADYSEQWKSAGRVRRERSLKELFPYRSRLVRKPKKLTAVQEKALECLIQGPVLFISRNGSTITSNNVASMGTFKALVTKKRAVMNWIDHETCEFKLRRVA